MAKIFDEAGNPITDEAGHGLYDEAGIAETVSGTLGPTGLLTSFLRSPRTVTGVLSFVGTEGRKAISYRSVGGSL